MKRKEIEKAIDGGFRILSEVFPLKSNLYFPLIYSTLVWALEKQEEWEEKIFSWEIWPDPGFVRTKPDAFILNFFGNNKSLALNFKEEVKEKDLKTLRKSFECLYPILGLKDPFLSCLFFEELKSEDYKKIVDNFEKRLYQAKRQLKTLKARPDLILRLKNFAFNASSLGLNILSQSKVQSAVVGLVKKAMKEKDE